MLGFSDRLGWCARWVGLLLTISLVITAPAVAAADSVRFNIVAQPLSTGLKLFSEQADMVLLYKYSDIDGRGGSAVLGPMEKHAALGRLLQSTGLEAVYSSDNAATIRIILTARTNNPSRASGAADDGQEQTGDPSPIRLAQAGQGVEASSPSTGEATSPDHGQPLEQIVVTAQMRAESAHDVPQSLTALSNDVLERNAISGLSDMAAYVPGLTVNNSGYIAGNQLIMRGITSGNDVNATVAMYVDDVPFGSGTSYSGTSGFALDTTSFDLQRVEFLRGPQGTLYGANAFGGVVKYVLTPPSPTDFSGRIQLDDSGTYHGADNVGLRATVNLPLSDAWAVRVTGIRNHDSGYIDNLATDGVLSRHWDPTDTTYGRVALLGKLSDDVTLHATFMDQEIAQHGSSRVDIDPTTLQPTSGNLDEARALRESYSQRFRLYSVSLEDNLDFATLTTVAAYQTIRSYTFQDVTLFAELFGSTAAAAGTPINESAIPAEYYTSKSTAEIRLASKGDSSFGWLTGFYYTHEDNRSNTYIQGYYNGMYVPSFNMLELVEPTTYAEYTGYLDGTYTFTPRLDAQVGVRLTHNDQNVSQISSGILGGTSFAAPGSDETVATYLATVRYHLDAQNMLYLRAASGYRPGGPNLVLAEYTGNTSFKPDKLWNYEAGAKLQPTRWLGMDASVYYIRWTDIQLQGICCGGLGVFQNGGRADSKGAEVSWILQPVRPWTINASVAYTDAKLDDPIPDLGAAAGAALPNVPRFSTALATDYHYALFTFPADMGAAWNFTGRRNSGYLGSPSLPYVPLSSYSTLDLHAGVDVGRFNFNLYGKNVLNKWALLNVDTSDVLYRGAVLRPRTIGIMMTTTF
jgi:iron complex outermembrane receptor protein